MLKFRNMFAVTPPMWCMHHSAYEATIKSMTLVVVYTRLYSFSSCSKKLYN